MSSRTCAVAVLLAAGLTTTAAAQSAPRALVERAVAAMGGEAALRGLTGIAVDYHFAQFGIGQSELPESPPRATVSYGRFVHDYRGTRRALTQDNRPLAGGVQRQRQVAGAAAGMNEANGVQAPLAPGALSGQLRTMRLSPERILLAALDAPGSLSALPPRTFRGAPHDGVRITGQDTVTVWFDRRSGLPLVIETVTDDPVLGDRSTQTWWTRWQSSGAIRLPRQLDVMLNGQLSQQVYFTSVTANPALPDSLFAIPDSIARRAQPMGVAAAPLPVTFNRIAPLVQRVEGGTHFSLVVEQETQLIVVEAPQTTARSRAVIDSLRRAFPGKRIGAVVMTHYHWDHSGGLREYIAEGIPVITLAENAAFVRQMAAAPRTVSPDLQAARRRTPVIQTFTDSLVIGAGSGRVILYRQPSTHVEGILTAWVPEAALLFTSDVLSPGGILAPLGSWEIARMARARGLQPERFAGGHGGIAAWADVERAAATFTP